MQWYWATPQRCSVNALKHQSGWPNSAVVYGAVSGCSGTGPLHSDARPMHISHDRQISDDRQINRWKSPLHKATTFAAGV